MNNLSKTDIEARNHLLALDNKILHLEQEHELLQHQQLDERVISNLAHEILDEIHELKEEMKLVKNQVFSNKESIYIYLEQLRRDQQHEKVDQDKLETKLIEFKNLLVRLINHLELRDKDFMNKLDNYRTEVDKVKQLEQDRQQNQTEYQEIKTLLQTLRDNLMQSQHDYKKVMKEKYKHKYDEKLKEQEEKMKVFIEQIQSNDTGILGKITHLESEIVRLSGFIQSLQIDLDKIQQYIMLVQVAEPEHIEKVVQEKIRLENQLLQAQQHMDTLKHELHTIKK